MWKSISRNHIRFDNDDVDIVLIYERGIWWLAGQRIIGLPHPPIQLKSHSEKEAMQEVFNMVSKSFISILQGLNP